MARRKLFTCMILALVVAFLVGLGIWRLAFHQSISSAPTKFKMGIQKTNIYAPYFVAQEKGFFRKQNLRVEGVEFSSANLMALALASGRIDGTATSAFPVIFAMEQNQRGIFKCYLVNYITIDSFPDHILVKKDSSITSLSDLKGKKIGVYPGSSILTYARLILKEFMDPDTEVEFVQLKPSLHIQALGTGLVDAVFSLDPVATVCVESGVGRSIVEGPLPRYFMDPLPGSSSTFSTRFAKKNPDIAVLVVQAMYQAVDFIADDRNRDELDHIIAKYTGIKESTARRLGRLRYWKIGQINRRAVQRLADIFFENDVLQSKIDTSTLYYE